jgi:6-phosphogluconolactonase
MACPEPDLQVVEGPGELAVAAARHVARALREASGATEPIRLALSGGTTPLRTYRLLAADTARFPVPWSRVQVFWGDERFVPADDPQSNYRAACEALLDHLPEPPAGLFPVPTSATTPEAAAEQYEATLRGAFAVPAQEVPRFDLVLLGLGTDGHTASLFHGPLPEETDLRLVAGVRRDDVNPARVTLTARTLNHARQILFLVSGASKADILHSVLQAAGPDPELPATWIRPVRGRLLWMADRPAARRHREQAP